jgi:hypothetical protein
VARANDAASVLGAVWLSVCVASSISFVGGCGAAEPAEAETGAGGTGGTGGTGNATGGMGGASGGASGAAGGRSGTGGRSAGTGAAGAALVSCDAAFAVGPDGFVRAPAAGGGCWHGHASAGGDASSTVMPTDFATCGVDCVLRARGTVGPAAAAGSVFLGFQVNQRAGSSTKMTLVPTGTGLSVRYTNTGESPVVRVQISSGSAASTRWCALLTSTSAMIPYAMFNTACWENGAGIAYDREPIDSVELVVPGGAAPAPFDITLVSVKDT